MTGASRVKDRLAETKAQIVFVQEHRTEGARMSEVQAQASKQGWRGVMSAALRSSCGGLSGGTAVFVNKGVGLTTLKVPPGIRAPAPHRVSLCFANIMGGAVLASIYLTTGVGMEGDNTELLDRLGELLSALHRPFILGGRFQHVTRRVGTVRVASGGERQGSGTSP